MKKNVEAELWLLFVTFLWGWSFPLMKISVYYIPPITFLFYRFGIASLLLYIVFKNDILSNLNAIVPGVIIGLSLFMGQGLQTVGLVYTSSSHSAFITSLYIVFSPVIAYFMLREKIRYINILSLLTALTGLYLLSGVGISILNMNLGDLLTLFCALSFAFQVVLIQKYTYEGYNYKALTFWQVIVSFIGYAIYIFYVGDLIITYNIVVWLSILYTSIVSTVIALIIILKYQKHTTVQRASIIYTGEPLFAYLISFLMLGESLDVYGYLGAFLIISSIVILQLKH